MKARERLITFLRHARQSPDAPYVFDIEGDDHVAAAYVQRMRVELSNMRKELKLQGKSLRRFSMRVGGYMAFTKLDPATLGKTIAMTRVSLLYGEDATFRFDKSVDELASLITHDLAS